MRSRHLLPAALFIGAAALVAPLALAQTAAPPVPDPGPVDEGYEVSELVIVARRPGRDPSQAATECLWGELPSDQQQALTRMAETAVRTLADHDTVPLTNAALQDGAVAAALVACGGSDNPAHIPFARTALAAFAVENATARALARNRTPEVKLRTAWRALSHVQRESMLTAAVNPDEEPEDLDTLFSGVFRALRIVRPLSAWNPLEYRNGTTTHRVVYFLEAYSVRVAMERRF